MCKRLMCISFGHARTSMLAHEAFQDWDIRITGRLEDAERHLCDERYLVGLVVHPGDVNSRPLRELAGFLHRHRHVEWVAVVAPRSLDTGLYRDLLADYLVDYHTAPVDPRRLSATLGHAHGMAVLRRSAASAADDRHGASPLVGNCDAMIRLRADIDRVARVAAPVLIQGPSGSGKELAARAIHAQSARRHAPFVPINCGAIPASLIHAELFGYRRGAFTGAVRDKPGLIESADGGTLFLDEIGDLPKELQATLLRFLQEGSICRLGSVQTIRVDVRVVAATHVNLQRAIADGAFREDLYHRLAVLPVTVPSLRERRADLPLLAAHFLCRFEQEGSARPKRFSEDALAAIAAHDWPGNVRELVNRVQRALVMSDTGAITPGDLGLGSPAAGRGGAARSRAARHSERAALNECLDRHGRNVSRAARDLGVSRPTMYRLLDKYDLRP